MYDPESNTFGSYNPEGKPETFYKPTSSGYYGRVEKAEVSKGGSISTRCPGRKIQVVLAAADAGFRHLNIRAAYNIPAIHCRKNEFIFDRSASWNIYARYAAGRI